MNNNITGVINRCTMYVLKYCNELEIDFHAISVHEMFAVHHCKVSLCQSSL